MPNSCAFGASARSSSSWPIVATKSPLPDPAQPRVLERIRVVALDGDRRNRALVAAVDEAAFPARTPPAIDVARVQHPVAEPPRRRSCRRGGIPCRPPGPRRRSPARRNANALAMLSTRERQLAALARHVVETAQRHRVLGTGDRSLELELAESGRLARSTAHTRERSADVRRPAVRRRTSRMSRAISGQDTGQAVSGARTMPASASSCKSWRSRASPGSAQGPACAVPARQQARPSACRARFAACAVRLERIVST